MLDDIIIDSRLTQSKNGAIRNSETINNSNTDNKPTSEQKWWVSLLLGLLFAFISSPLFYHFTNAISNMIFGECIILYEECLIENYGVIGGVTLLGIIIHTIIFSLLIRFLLW